MTSQPSSIVVLTGAGISVESGIASFRDRDGIWARVDWRDYATTDAFARHPARVHDFYNRRRHSVAEAKPNAAHLALARLEAAFPGEFTLITQNIDHLHEAAGSKNLIHMHGDLFCALCEACHQRSRWHGDMTTSSQCPQCSTIGRLRPDVVWFGEMPYHMDRIYRALGQAELFVAIGTSGHVYPAADFVEEAKHAGARTIELNLEPSETASAFDEMVLGRATEIVPAFVEGLLATV